MKIKYLLSDLDGVIRKFPSERDEAIERKFGLTLGRLFQTTFEKNLLTKYKFSLTNFLIKFHS